MEQDAPFSSLPERWSEISEFPGYSVSDWGNVMNMKTRSLVTPTINGSGVAMVGLMKFNEVRQRSIQNKRSLALLVAREYVRPHQNPAFDTPIHLDGDRSNNHYTNIMWRPLWFARKYAQQFFDEHITVIAPIEDVETHIQYENSMAAAVTHGLLDNEIYVSMVNNTYVWPTGQIFRQVV